MGAPKWPPSPPGDAARLGGAVARRGHAREQAPKWPQGPRVTRHASAEPWRAAVTRESGPEMAPLLCVEGGGDPGPGGGVGDGSGAGRQVVVEVLGLAGGRNDAGDGGMAEDPLEKELAPARAPEVRRPRRERPAAHALEQRTPGEGAIHEYGDAAIARQRQDSSLGPA